MVDYGNLGRDVLAKIQTHIKQAYAESHGKLRADEKTELHLNKDLDHELKLISDEVRVLSIAMDGLSSREYMKTKAQHGESLQEVREKILKQVFHNRDNILKDIQEVMKRIDHVENIEVKQMQIEVEMEHIDTALKNMTLESRKSLEELRDWLKSMNAHKTVEAFMEHANY